nr:metal transporter nramp5 [Quercus suber]
MGYVKPPAGAVIKGLFVPKLSGQGAIENAIALLGTLIVPHNLFLHSALVLCRKVRGSVHGINGFLDLKMKKWIRNLMTRRIAIAPTLIVSIIGGSKGAAQLIIISSIMVISWILGVAFTGFNMYFLITAFVGWLIHNKLPEIANVFVGIIVFPLMLVYVLAILYLTFRKDTAVTFIEPITLDHPVVQNNMENGLSNSCEVVEADRIPYTQDLADIQLPE